MEQETESTWCNRQAIPGTENYPGPWHERGGEPHYPCAEVTVAEDGITHIFTDDEPPRP